MRGLSTSAQGFERKLPPGAAPDWVHILPAGRIIGRDGRSFTLGDPAAVIAAFRAGSIDLPIDYEHQNNKEEARLRGPIPAAGWIKELEARDTGLWGRVEWTDRARKMIANKEYRYLSPVISYDPKTTEVVKITGAGLVHSPNLHLTALSNQETSMVADATFLQRVIAVLDLDPDTTPDEVILIIDQMNCALVEMQGKSNAKEISGINSADQSQTPDPAKFVPIATMEALLAERSVEIATADEARKQFKVAQAMEKGHISPGMRDWAISLCRSDEASFDAFVTKTPAMFAHLFKPITTLYEHSAGKSIAASDEATAICEQLGIAPSSLAE